MEGIRTFLLWGRQSLNIGSVHSRLLIDLTQHCSSYWKETLPSKAGSHQSSLPNHLHTDPTASSDLLTVDDEQGRVMQFLVQGTFWRSQMLILMGFVCLGKLKRLDWSSTTLEHCEQANGAPADLLYPLASLWALQQLMRWLQLMMVPSISCTAIVLTIDILKTKGSQTRQASTTASTEENQRKGKEVFNPFPSQHQTYHRIFDS